MTIISFPTAKVNRNSSYHNTTIIRFIYHEIGTGDISSTKQSRPYRSTKPHGAGIYQTLGMRLLHFGYLTKGKISVPLQTKNNN